MLEPVIPHDDAQRLRSLKALALLDSPIEERFERITRMLAHALKVPIAAFSLVDKKRQWFKSLQGLNEIETPREVSFCSHAILQDEMMLVHDARQDERFHDNPLVTGHLQMQFYAGCPIRSPDGNRVGVLCAIDRQPREMDESSIQALRDISDVLESELRWSQAAKIQTSLLNELETAQRLALIDPLTRLWNRRGIMEFIKRKWKEDGRNKRPLAIVMADLDHFKKVNEKYGQAAGDDVLIAVGKRLLGTLRTEDAIGRTGGGQFLIVLSGCKPDRLKATIERIRHKIIQTPIIIDAGKMFVTLSFGGAVIIPDSAIPIEAIAKLANEALSKAKQLGRNRVEVA